MKLPGPFLSQESQKLFAGGYLVRRYAKNEFVGLSQNKPFWLAGPP